MDMVNVKINGVDYSVPAGITVLEACRYAGIDIPTLCYLKDINAIGACRLCLVEVKGARGLVTACVYPINDGMEIQTNTERIRAVRKTNLELVLSAHEKKCLSCIRSTSCELQKLAQEYKCDEDRFVYGPKAVKKPLDTSSVSIIRDNNKCILCRRCVAACNKLQGIGAIGAVNRGFDSEIRCAFERELAETSCINCGQCVVACPSARSTKRTTPRRSSTRWAIPRSTLPSAALRPSVPQSANASATNPVPTPKARWSPRSRLSALTAYTT